MKDIERTEEPQMSESDRMRLESYGHDQFNYDLGVATDIWACIERLKSGKAIPADQPYSALVGLSVQVEAILPAGHLVARSAMGERLITQIQHEAVKASYDAITGEIKAGS